MPDPANCQWPLDKEVTDKTMDNTPTHRKCFPDGSPDHTNGKTRNVSCFFRLLRPLNTKRKIDVISSVQEDIQAVLQVPNESQTMSKEEFDRVLLERINSLMNDQLRRKDDQIIALKNQVNRLTEDLDRLLSNSNVDTIIRLTTEEHDRVLQKRINSRIDDQLRQTDDQLIALKSQVLWLTESLELLLSKPNVDITIPQTMGEEEHDRVLQERTNPLINYRLRQSEVKITKLQNHVLQIAKDLNRLLSNPNIDTIIRQTNNSNLSQTEDKAVASCSNNEEQEPYFVTGLVETDITGARPTPNTSLV